MVSFIKSARADVLTFAAVATDLLLFFATVLNEAVDKEARKALDVWLDDVAPGRSIDLHP